MSKEVDTCVNLPPENIKNYVTEDKKLSKIDKNSYDLSILFNDMSKLPEFLRARDLIKLGLFNSASDLSWAMKRNQSPPFIRLSAKKIIFSRICLFEWLRQKSLPADIKEGEEHART